MYLSRIKLDTNRRDTKRAVASPHVTHASVESCFDAKNRSIWRFDYLRGNLYLLLVSEALPNFENFAKQHCGVGIMGESKPYLPVISSIKTGQQLRFRLRGNTVHSKAGERGTRGKVLPHLTDRHKKLWLVDKSVANGFSLNEDSFELIESGRQRFWRDSSHVDLTYGVFEGLLVVEDTNLFANALTQGIGRAKAYGCGLITVMGSK